MACSSRVVCVGDAQRLVVRVHEAPRIGTAAARRALELHARGIGSARAVQHLVSVIETEFDDYTKRAFRKKHARGDPQRGGVAL